MSRRFEGKAVIVTGGAAGIGAATAAAFAREGAGVLVADLDAEGALATSERISADGGRAIALQVDVTRDGDARAMVDRAIEAFGGLDAAFNNAGIEGRPAPLAEGTEEEVDRVVAVSLKGTWLCMKHEIPAMLDRGGGTIVNMASVAGLVGYPSMSPYVAAKHGVVGLTRAAALDYAERGIRVNAVCPAVIHTAMIDRFTGGDPERLSALAASHPVNRLGTADEVAEAVLFLASEGASFMTGHPMPVDGGYLTR